MRIVNVIVEHAGNNLSAYIEGAPIIVVGDDIKEIEDNMKEAVDLYLETCTEQHINPVPTLTGPVKLKFKADAAG